MKFVRSVVFILFSLTVSVSCFRLQQNQTDRVSKVENGDTICIENVPYQVIIKVAGTYICGGALIKPNIVLTAAHCVEEALALKLKLYVVAGTHSTRWYPGHSLFDKSISIAAEQMEMHPRYKKRPVDTIDVNDVALIKLTKNFPITSRIRPISLPKQDVRVNDGLTLAGIGQINADTRSNCLRFYKPRVVDCSYYDARMPSFKDIFCHKGDSGERTHVGDSGSPVANDRNELVGIHTATAPIHYYQKAINVYYYLDWIRETIAHIFTNEI